METYVLKSAKISNRGAFNAQYKNYSVNLKFEGHTEDALWNLREQDFNLATISPDGTLTDLPAMRPGTIFTGEVQHLTSKNNKAYTRFKGDISMAPGAPAAAPTATPVDDSQNIVNPTLDDVIDTWTYLVGRAQIGFAKVNVQADAQALNAAAATLMIDMQKRGVKIPKNVKE